MFPPFESILLVLISGLMLAAIPGPSMLYVLSRSMGQSCNAGLVSSAGLAFGGMLHAFAASLGLSSIIALNPDLFIAIQVFGSLYLAYLGITMMNEKIESDEIKITTVGQMNYRKIFVQGVIVEISNPKTILFFLAFIPSILSSTESYSSGQLLFLGLLVPLTALPSDLIVSFAGGKMATKLKSNIRLANQINKLAGIFLIFLSLRLALS